MQSLPESGKNRRQDAAKEDFPDGGAGQQRDGVGKAGISAAQAEAQINPQPEEHADEQKISQPPGTDRTQEPIEKPQSATQ